MPVRPCQRSIGLPRHPTKFYFPYLKAAKPKPKPKPKAGARRAGSGGAGGGGGAKASGKLLSPVVETGPLGDEVVGVLKGYTNRLVLTLEGSAYRAGGGLIEACLGFLSRGNALAAIALQVGGHGGDPVCLCKKRRGRIA